MKKLFIVLAVASLGFVACNNEGETKTSEDSSTVVTPGGDTATVVTTTTQDTTNVKPLDTTGTKVDTTSKMK